MDERDTEITEDHQETEPGVLSEHTVESAQPDAVPAERTGGPPRRDDLTVTPSEMGRRVLQDATETRTRQDGD